jgi:hypothetical protein
MTKQQAISLHLSKWIGLDVELCREPNYTATGWYKVVAFPCGKRFNPFAATTEGRAQAYECLLHALECSIQIDWFPGFIRVWAHNNKPENQIYTVQHVDGKGPRNSATLEAIYYATGGQPGQWEES